MSLHRSSSSGGDMAKFSDLKRIGEGTYGVVFSGIHKKTGQKVALKKISLDKDNEGIPSTCIREISLLKDLSHTNIVRLFDVIHANWDLYLVFEFIDRDLKGLLDRLPGKCLPPSHVKSFVWQLFQALAYCHTRRVIHRDLKPQNLLVSDKGIIKLADFGLARNFSIPSRAYTHEVVTLWYRAPEVLLGGRYYSTAIDMWSLGCIFVEMAIGKALFSGDSEIDQLYKIFRLLGTPTPEIWPGVEKLQDYKDTFPKWKKTEAGIKAVMKNLDPDGIMMAQDMLKYIPDERLTAKEGLSHRYLRDVQFNPPEIRSLLRPTSTDSTTTGTSSVGDDQEGSSNNYTEDSDAF